MTNKFTRAEKRIVLDALARDAVRHPNPFNDLACSWNNGVCAVYIVGKDVLEIEGRRDLVKVPFLLWKKPTEIKGKTARESVMYLEYEQFHEKVEKRLFTDGTFPETLTLWGNSISIDALASGYVPYSFGFGHNADEREVVRVRTSSEYCDFVNRVVPEVLKRREARKERVIADMTEWNRFKTRLGMYKPAEFGRDQPY